MKNMICLLVTLLSLALPQLAAAQSSWLRGEIGSAQTVSNFFQIPSKTATRFDLPEGASQIYGRIEGFVELSKSQGLRFVYAPFQTTYSMAAPNANPVFNGETFDGSGDLSIGYKFNSYRASYVWLFSESSGFSPRAGFTLKVRDAFIRVSDATKTSENSNIGLVPLLYLGFDYELKPIVLVFDLDGLAARQGRAFDGRLEAQYDLGAQRVGAGFRFLDGGADNQTVYNFAQFSYYYASLEMRF